MCAAEVLSMVGVFAFPALLPRFLASWALSNTQAGWLNAIYFLGYTVAVPILVSLTDRIDARRVYLFSTAVAAIASMGFAWVTTGFWTGLLFRALGGFGLAGTFIPGLKALVDRLEGRAQARAVSFYTASFGIGTSLSFFLSGEVARRLDWRATFAVAAIFAVAAFLLAAVVIRPKPPSSGGQPLFRVLDFRPVFRNREAMVFIFAYAAHMWELFAVRAWMVAFLAFSLSQQGVSGSWLSPTTVVAISAFMGVWANVGGAEIAIRRNRRRTLCLIMGGSALLASVIGFTALLPYPLVTLLCILYGMFVQGDSAALHTSTVQAAAVHLRGATLAVQSLLGFASASLSPLVVGMVLDLAGGQTVTGWGLAFVTMGVVVALGPVIIAVGSQERERIVISNQ
jgi:MFS family permease